MTSDTNHLDLADVRLLNEYQHLHLLN